jgi:FtsZ-interacting cell division protein ZipA
VILVIGAIILIIIIVVVVIWISRRSRSRTIGEEETT